MSNRNRSVNTSGNRNVSGNKSGSIGRNVSRKMIRGTAGVMSFMLVTVSVMPAYAATTDQKVAGKEEVVYAMADAAGSVSDIEVVNIFQGGSVTDYGNYSAVKMLTTNDEINMNQDVVTFTSDADKVYYQGTLNKSDIPWNINITYTLDGKTISAEDLAGRSGKLSMHIVITKNENCTGDFYENYALQAAFTLDTEKCKNITTDAGTMANVGSDKQISYTILPGKGIDTVLTADVTDFEMDAAAINGVRLNLNVNIDDEELMSKVTELMEATDKLNSGANTVSDGTNTLAGGTSSLSDGAATLYQGAGSLDSGISVLQTGVVNMQTGLNTLNEKSGDLTSGSGQMLAGLESLQSNLNGISVTADQLAQLTSSSAAIKQGITDLKSGIDTLQANLGYAQYQALMAQNGLNITQLQAGNTAAVNSLTTQIAALQASLDTVKEIPGMEEQTAQLQGQIDSLQNIVTLLTGNNAAISGTEAYLNNLSTAVTALKQGAASLQTNYEAFDNAIGQLANTLSGLLVNMTVLQTGVNTLVESYKTLDGGISEYTNGVAAIAAGYQQLADGVTTLAAGSSQLLTGSASLSSGAAELVSGASALSDGTTQLAAGTEELYSKTSGMDTQVQDQIDEIVASIQGDDSENVSFVSEKNKDVDSVQFVIKTKEIKKTEAAVTEQTEAESLNLWQKLLKLFGL